MLTHHLSKLACLVLIGLLPALSQAQKPNAIATGAPLTAQSRTVPGIVRPYPPTITATPEKPVFHPSSNPLYGDTLVLAATLKTFKLIPTKSWTVRDCAANKYVQVKQFQSTTSNQIRTVEIVNECVHTCYSIYVDGWYHKTMYPKAVNSSDFVMKNTKDNLGDFYGEKSFGTPVYWIVYRQITEPKKRREVMKWIINHLKRLRAQYC